MNGRKHGPGGKEAWQPDRIHRWGQSGAFLVRGRSGVESGWRFFSLVVEPGWIDRDAGEESKAYAGGNNFKQAR